MSVTVQQVAEVSQRHVVAVVPNRVAVHRPAGTLREVRRRRRGGRRSDGGRAQSVELAQHPVEAVLRVVEQAPVVGDEVAAALVTQLAVDGRLEERRHPREVGQRPRHHHRLFGGRVRAAAGWRTGHSFQLEAQLIQSVDIVAKPMVRLYTTQTRHITT